MIFFYFVGGKMDSFKTFSAVLILFLLTAYGCTGVGEMRDRYWPTGPSEYQLEMNRKDINSQEQKLANSIYPVDTQLSLLLRRLSLRDTYPAQNWKEELSMDFPWLNGIVIINTEGDILSAHPREGIKRLEFDVLFPRGLDLPQGKTMLAVEDTVLGPEVLIAVPVYRDFQVDALIIAHFDPRSFISRSADPEKLVLVAADQVIWTGGQKEIGSRLENIDWQEKTRRRISGKIKLEGDEFFWFARAVDQDWIIYMLKDG